MLPLYILGFDRIRQSILWLYSLTIKGIKWLRSGLNVRPYFYHTHTVDPYDKNNYIIIGNIGDGSYGTIRHAVRKTDHLAVAIKRVPKDTIVYMGSVPKEYVIMKELSDASGVSIDVCERKEPNPGIVKVFGIEEDDDSFYIIMEYFNGGDLDHFMDDYDTLNPQMAMYILEQLLDALEYMFSKNIVHRDIKLDNILLRDNESMKIALTDFGFATHSNHLLEDSYGTLHYAAPELFWGLPYDGQKADIWSTGVVLYKMLFGRMPFDVEDAKNDTRADYINRILKDDPFKDIHHSDETVQPCIDILRRMLFKDPDLRPTIKHIRLSCILHAEDE